MEGSNNLLTLLRLGAPANYFKLATVPAATAIRSNDMFLALSPKRLYRFDGRYDVRFLFTRGSDIYFSALDGFTFDYVSWPDFEVAAKEGRITYGILPDGLEPPSAMPIYRAPADIRAVMLDFDQTITREHSVTKKWSSEGIPTNKPVQFLFADLDLLMHLIDTYTVSVVSFGSKPVIHQLLSAGAAAHLNISPQEGRVFTNASVQILTPSDFGFEDEHSLPGNKRQMIQMVLENAQFPRSAYIFIDDDGNNVRQAASMGLYAVQAVPDGLTVAIWNNAYSLVAAAASTAAVPVVARAAAPPVAPAVPTVPTLSSYLPTSSDRSKVLVYGPVTSMADVRQGGTYGFQTRAGVLALHLTVVVPRSYFFKDKAGKSFMESAPGLSQLVDEGKVFTVDWSDYFPIDAVPRSGRTYRLMDFLATSRAVDYRIVTSDVFVHDALAPSDIYGFKTLGGVYPLLLLSASRDALAFKDPRGDILTASSAEVAALLSQGKVFNINYSDYYDRALMEALPPRTAAVAAAPPAAPRAEIPNLTDFLSKTDLPDDDEIIVTTPVANIDDMAMYAPYGFKSAAGKMIRFVLENITNGRVFKFLGPQGGSFVEQKQRLVRLIESGRVVKVHNRADYFGGARRTRRPSKSRSSSRKSRKSRSPAPRRKSRSPRQKSRSRGRGRKTGI